MSIQHKRSKGRCTIKVPRIPDMEQSKHAVIDSLPAKASQESYAYAIDEFISWYCSEPRLAFNCARSCRGIGAYSDYPYSGSSTESPRLELSHGPLS